MVCCDGYERLNESKTCLRKVDEHECTELIQVWDKQTLAPNGVSVNNKDDNNYYNIIVVIFQLIKANYDNAIATSLLRGLQEANDKRTLPPPIGSK